MSDTITLSVCSHMKIRAAHAATPDDDSEKVIVFAPGRRSRACYGTELVMGPERLHNTHQLFGCEPERLRVPHLWPSSGKRGRHTGP